MQQIKFGSGSARNVGVSIRGNMSGVDAMIVTGTNERVQESKYAANISSQDLSCCSRKTVFFVFSPDQFSIFESCHGGRSGRALGTGIGPNRH
jgi:hypothetical protein